jgi:hypothetical protein
MSSLLRKTITVAFILIFASDLFAPSFNSFVILRSEPVDPFRNLIHAIGRVETKFDTLAYNPEEKAVGYFQIRPIRVQDYNKRTGSKLLLKDMYDYDTSEKVFLYYASELGPYKFERIAKNWNGSGIKTIQYWRQVRKYL